MKTISIGRDLNSTIVIDQVHGKVSNEHADIEIRDGQLIFIDHSSNGTLINGRTIHNNSIAIRNGDVISLAGSYVLPWPAILDNFPEFQKRTEIFNDSQIGPLGSDRKTEMFDGARVQPIVLDRATETIDHSASESDIADAKPTAADGMVGQLNDFTQEEIDETLEKFNLGAFLSSWVWALAKGIYWPLLIIPISFVPYLGQACSLFLCTYLGIIGYRKAWQSYKGDSFAIFMAKQRKWVVLGCFLFILFALIQFCSLYFILIEI